MQSTFPWAPFEMQIQSANKGGVDIGSDAAKSRRCNNVPLKYERHQLCSLNLLLIDFRFLLVQYEI